MCIRDSSPIEVLEGLPKTKDFLRTPNQYGFATLKFIPNQKINFNLNYVYTGSMKLLHFSGAPEQDFDSLVISKDFSELGLKGSYKFGMKNTKIKLEIFGGIKNILDAYQEDFDSGKNRDSNYIYGPAIPRTFFIGLKLGNF